MRVVLAKITDKKWADKFQDGEMFLRSLGEFRRIENNYQGDFLEGSIANIDPLDDQAMDQFCPIDKSVRKYIMGGVSLLSEDLKNDKLFCMYGIELKGGHLLKDEPDPRILDFGDTMVIITDFKSFMDRVRNALSKCEKLHSFSRMDFGRVKYYNREKFFGALNAFHKTDIYQWQNEYRFLFKDMSACNSHYILNIGDIRDITITVPTKTFLSGIDIDWMSFKSFLFENLLWK